MRDDCEFAPIALLTLGKSASVWEWASRVNASPYERLICERLAGLREIMMGSCLIGPCGVPPAYEEFRQKEFNRDRDGSWVDEMQDGNDHSIDVVR